MYCVLCDCVIWFCQQPSEMGFHAGAKWVCKVLKEVAAGPCIQTHIISRRLKDTLGPMKSMRCTTGPDGCDGYKVCVEWKKCDGYVLPYNHHYNY